MNGRIGADYEIIRELRRGPWVTVYEARHRILGRRTLIKWLNPEHQGDDEMAGRLRREARLGAAVDHPNAARIYGVGDADGRPYVAIEWIEGEDLETVMKREGKLPPTRVLRLARDLLAGLSAIHEAGVVHRDLSPANVRITSTGLARITDFGLATGRFDPRFTLPGAVVGTPGYLAPEQASGKEIDARADLFACGVLLYEALTGNPLFLDTDLIATLKRVRTQPVPSLEGRFEGLPTGFGKWLDHLLEKDPIKRWGSSQEATEALLPIVAAAEPESVAEPAAPKRAFIAIPSSILPILGFAIAIAVVVQIIRPWPKTPIQPPELVVPKNTVSIDSPGVSRTPASIGDSLLPAKNSDSGPSMHTRPETRPGEQAIQTKGEGEQKQLKVRTADTPDRSKAVQSPPDLSQRDRSPEQLSRTPGLKPDPARPASGPGYMVIRTSPWAEVYLEGLRLGVTPGLAPVKWNAGNVKLTLDNPGFPPIQIDTTIVASETLHVSINLEEKVGTLRITATPWAKVYADETPLGDTPLGRSIHVTPGPHSVRFVHPEFGEVVRKIEVQAGDVLDLKVDMAREGTAFAPHQDGQKR